ncbi:MAG: hypothetical protein ABSC88_02715 [Terracidiphilus sp.]|jgi:hypothetical protein|nr:hypothetical protein [Terracidiphilus sp.]
METGPNTAKAVRDAAPAILATLVQEDRNEARLWRARIENLFFSAVLASFAISSFFIGKVTPASAGLFRILTLFVDCSLVAMLAALYFLRVRPDLVALRKSQRYRQDLLVSSVKGHLAGFDPFKDCEDIEPSITDTDLDWLCGLSLAAISAKMIVVAAFATSFLPAAQAH